jgi:hypothetical protein
MPKIQLAKGMEHGYSTECEKGKPINIYKATTTMILYKVLIHSLWLDFATATEKYTSLVDTKLALHRFNNGEIGLIMWKASMQGYVQCFS